MSPRCVRAMGVCRAKQAMGIDILYIIYAMGEGKSDPVETGLTGPVATALTHKAILQASRASSTSMVGTAAPFRSVP